MVKQKNKHWLQLIVNKPFLRTGPSPKHSSKAREDAKRYETKGQPTEYGAFIMGKMGLL